MWGLLVAFAAGIATGRFGKRLLPRKGSGDRPVGAMPTDPHVEAAIQDARRRAGRL